MSGHIDLLTSRTSATARSSWFDVADDCAMPTFPAAHPDSGACAHAAVVWLPAHPGLAAARGLAGEYQASAAPVPPGRATGAVARAPALIGDHIGLDEIADGIWAVYFYDYLLGHLNEREGHVQGVHVRAKTSR